MDDGWEESQRWRDAMRTEGMAPGQACPPARDIYDTVSGLASPSLRRRVIAHTGRCPHCAELWQCAMRMIHPVDAKN